MGVVRPIGTLGGALGRPDPDALPVVALSHAAIMERGTAPHIIVRALATTTRLLAMVGAVVFLHVFLHKLF
jgi:hypothetical protein